MLQILAFPMLVNGDTIKRNVNSWTSCILKLSKQLENNGFAKSCGKDIYRVLCHFFWWDYASRENYASGWQLANQLLPLPVVATGSEKISSKFPKESVVCLSLVSPQVPLIHTVRHILYHLLRVPCSGRLLRARCKSLRQTLSEKTDYL